MQHERGPTATCIVIAAGTLFGFGRPGLIADHGGLPFLWPNAVVVSEFLERRVQYGQRVLVDDAAIRYVLRDLTPQDHIADQYYLQYRGKTGAAAYALAVAEGWFDYIVLDGTTSSASVALERAISPVVGARYVERNRAMQPSTGEDAVIYERTSPPVTRSPDAPVLVVDSPRSGATIVAGGRTPVVEMVGHVDRAPIGALVQVDVFTDRWYQQGPLLMPAPGTGYFSLRVVLGGQGPHRCNHAIRVRLLGGAERIIDELSIAGVRRSAPDSIDVPCPSP